MNPRPQAPNSLDAFRLAPSPLEIRPMRRDLFVIPLLALSALLLLPVSAEAATISADGVTCTLADAIVAANTDTMTGGCPAGDPGLDTIELNADVTLAAIDPGSSAVDGGSSGLPDVTDDLILRAGLADLIQRDPTFTCDVLTADPVFRFLYLASGELTIEDLRFENGCLVSPGSADGGGLFTADGTRLTLSGITVRNQGLYTTSSSDGGFLSHGGDDLLIESSLFEGITVDAGSSLQGGVIFIDGEPAELRDVVFRNLDLSTLSSYQGGAIYVSGETLTVSNALIEEVSAQSTSSLQGGGIYASGTFNQIFLNDVTVRQVTGETDSSLSGGALYLSAPTQAANIALSHIDSIAGSTSSCSGGAIFLSDDPTLFENLVVEDVECSAGASARGGAMFISSSSSTGYVLRNCSIRNARVIYGDGAGRGGALYASGTVNLMERCAFVDNQVLPGANTTIFEGTGGALHFVGPARVKNVTVAGNSAQGASGVGEGEDGTSGLGGGIHLDLDDDESGSLSHVTVAGNQAIAGPGDAGFTDGSALGGGIYLGGMGEVTLEASLLSGNFVTPVGGDPTSEDCFNNGTPLISGGYNLAVAPDASCDLSAFADIVGLDPQLYPVDDYGCAVVLPDGTCVETAAIDQESWAVDWGSCAATDTFEDARAFLRRQDIIGVPNLDTDACDTGAFEAYDSDGDGVTDVPDLCPAIADPGQSNADGDEFGDACDLCFGGNDSGDTDTDGVCDDSDLCAGDDASGDSDTDGVCDDSDLCNGDDASGDSDTDGVCDDLDLCAGDDASGDSDTDGVCNDSDLCNGDDASGDSDTDGVCDNLDLCTGDDASGDSDADGVCDDLDLCTGDDASGDSDTDGVCDNIDLCNGDDASGDSDTDGVCDDLDICTGDDASGDADNDGVCANLDCDDDDPMVSCTPIFDNGFETGDTSLWTLVIGGAP
ncbi:MAG: hypothetical protein AAGD01_05985 [Acidobacteriota bacterium]